MYRIPREVKQDQVRRWALPDRVFFACGACHILAFAFLSRYPNAGFTALWIRPKADHTGNHIIVTRGEHAFDYHGHTNTSRLLDHMTQKARRRWPGWDFCSIPLPKDVLVSEHKSKTYDGLWLREPKQFQHDALPRAFGFLDRFPPPVRSGDQFQGG